MHPDGINMADTAILRFTVHFITRTFGLMANTIIHTINIGIQRTIIMASIIQVWWSKEFYNFKRDSI